VRISRNRPRDTRSLPHPCAPAAPQRSRVLRPAEFRAHTGKNSTTRGGVGKNHVPHEYTDRSRRPRLSGDAPRSGRYGRHLAVSVFGPLQTRRGPSRTPPSSSQTGLELLHAVRLVLPRVSKTFQQVVGLIRLGEVRISDHGYDELAADGIFARDVLKTAAEGTVVEDYPDYAKGPCVLVLQKDRRGEPMHVVWGIPKGASSPAVLITAYRPDLSRWEPDFLRRRK
jgi:hypothetical protein